MKNKKEYTLTANIRPWFRHSNEECECHHVFHKIRETIDAENFFDAQRQFKSIAKELIEKHEDYKQCAQCENDCKLDLRISAYKFQTGLFEEIDFKLSKLFEDLIDDINSYYSDVIERDPQMISLIIANGARKILRHIALKTTYSNKVKTDAMIRVREKLAEQTLNDFCPDVNPDARLYNTNYSFSLYIFKTYRQMLEEMRYYKELNATMPHDIEPNNFLDFQESILVRDYLETKDSN